MVNPDSEPRYRIDIATARKIAVTAQMLAPEARSAEPSIADVFQRLGCVQIDSLQAVRRSQELVLLAGALAARPRGGAGLGTQQPG